MVARNAQDGFIGKNNWRKIDPLSRPNENWHARSLHKWKARVIAGSLAAAVSASFPLHTCGNNVQPARHGLERFF